MGKRNLECDDDDDDDQLVENRYIFVPYDPLRNILIRLPAKSVLKFKSVCKQWRSLIQDPQFLKLHQSQSKPFPCFFLTGPNHLYLYSFNIEEKEEEEDTTTCVAKEYHILPYTSPTKLSYCNGFLCYSTCSSFRSGFTYWVLNLSTREHLKLPPVMPVGFSGLGVDPCSNKYTVVKFNQHSGCYVFTSGSTSWRKLITSAPASYRIVGTTCFINGAIHWNSLDGTIISFDIKTEKFGAIPVPQDFSNLHFPLLILHESHGCLCVFPPAHHQTTFNLWILVDYNNHCWLPRRFLLQDVPRMRINSFVIRDGDTLTTLQTSGGHYYLHVQTPLSSKKIDIIGLPPNINHMWIENYRENIVSLRDR